MKIAKGQFYRWTHKDTGVFRVIQAHKDIDTDRGVGFFRRRSVKVLGTDKVERLRFADHNIEVAT